MSLVVLATLALAALAGLAAHESTHYLTARAVGAPARFTYLWDGLLPTPAVESDPLKHTPWSWRVTSLAPLVVLVPSLAVAFLWLTPPPADAQLLVAAWAMWCIALIPSPTDLRNVYYAHQVDELRAVAAGPHPNHQLAEGIA